MIVSNSPNGEQDLSQPLPMTEDLAILYVELHARIDAIRDYERARPWQYVDGEDFQPSVLAAYETAANQLTVAWSGYCEGLKQDDQRREAMGQQLIDGAVMEAIDASIKSQQRLWDSGKACEALLDQTLTAMNSLKTMDEVCGRWSSAQEGEPEQVFAQFTVRHWPAS